MTPNPISTLGPKSTGAGPKRPDNAPRPRRCVRPEGAPRCPACLRRPLRIAVVGGNGFANEASGQALGEQARCWTWRHFETAAEARAGASGVAPDVLVLAGDSKQASHRRSRRHLGEVLPGVHILTLVPAPKPGPILQALQEGATGVLVSPVQAGQVAGAIRRLARGEIVLCAQALAAVAQFFQAAARAAHGVELSPAEHLVMQALILGKDNAGIADQTGLGLETVHSHLVRIFEKLGVHNRKDALVKYLKLYGGGRVSTCGPLP